MNKIRVLVACEFSGRVRDAFTHRGFDAVSCDLLPSETVGQHHQGNVLDILDEGWDLMIAHPPCTYLTNSGVCRLFEDDDRWEQLDKGAKFFKALLDAKIPRIAVENPIMHKYAKARIQATPTQIINPWMFGHPESKATCLWLKNLPNLTATDDVKASMSGMHESVRQFGFLTANKADRWKIRSRTFVGIAQAMAQQWGNYLRTCAAVAALVLILASVGCKTVSVPAPIPVEYAR